jgi:alpha-glucosidase (family GH31 glycosyl hydrolase)
MTIVPTHEFLKEMGLRPFIISRSNSVGSGYFGGHWTGDNVANWEFLRLSISGNFLFQIFGMQMVGADICGFYLDTTE